MYSPALTVSPDSIVQRLFQFDERKRQVSRHKQFVSEMILGILGAKSTLVSNIARFLDEDQKLSYTERRLCRMLSNAKIDWDELRVRALELQSRMVGIDDVIAFDPGDLIKDHAWKMEGLYRVHDGSRGECGNGFEDFAVEAVQWKEGKKQHIPLYQKLSSAKCEDYISQNYQIIEAIRIVYEYLGENRGIWTFDRGHDRSRIFEKALLVFKMRWILRAKENRAVIPEDSRFLKPGAYHPGLMDVAKQIKLSDEPIQLRFPKTTGHLHVGWTRVKLPSDPNPDRFLSVVVIHDRRNLEPVVLLTTLEVRSAVDAAGVFGYYLERWGKEEGYRFTKSFLNSENIRTINWQATQALALLAHFTHILVTLFYRSAPEQIEAMCEERLKHFRHIDEIGYKYYRVAQLMRLLLLETRSNAASAALMTEVG